MILVTLKCDAECSAKISGRTEESVRGAANTVGWRRWSDAYVVSDTPEGDRSAKRKFYDLCPAHKPKDILR